MSSLLLIHISPPLIDPVSNHPINEHLFPSTLEYLCLPCGRAIPTIRNFVIIEDHIGGDASERLSHTDSSGPDIVILQCKIFKRGCTIFQLWMHLYQWRGRCISVNLIANKE